MSELKQLQSLLPENTRPISHALMAYLQLLEKWNSAYNLTAIRDVETMIPKHILDSLAIQPWIAGQRILDVGTGPGLPGIPLALCMPDKQFVLLDSNGKKTRFLQEVKRQLALSNVEIIQSRCENFSPAQGFDTVVSRAFSSLTQMVQWTQHLVKADGIWLAMKGQPPEAELLDLTHKYQVQHYEVPGLVGERCCVRIENTQ